jgi:tetratricopeptide (TPR) repeat protein
VTDLNIENTNLDNMMAKAALNVHADEGFLESQNDARQIEGESFYRLAKLYYDKADLDNAESFFIGALERSEFPRDTFGILKICGFLIRIYTQELLFNQAEEYIKISETTLKKYSESAGSLAGNFFYFQGVTQTYRADFEKATQSFALAYKRAQEQNEPDLVAKSLYSLSMSYFKERKFTESFTYINQLKELLKILKKDYLKGSIHILAAQIQTELGNYNEALSEYDMASEALQVKTSWNMFCFILLGKGVVYKKMGEFEKALVYFDLAKKSINHNRFKKLSATIDGEVNDVNDSSVDLYLDHHNRVIMEKTRGMIDFKHRFVLLEILFLLAKNPGDFYNKEDLAKDIWKDEYNPLIHDKLIYTSISRLRKLIEPKDGKRKYIIRGKDGYTFNPRINARFHKESDASTTSSLGNVDISSPV